MCNGSTYIVNECNRFNLTVITDNVPFVLYKKPQTVPVLIK